MQVTMALLSAMSDVSELEAMLQKFTSAYQAFTTN